MMLLETMLLLAMGEITFASKRLDDCGPNCLLCRVKGCMMCKSGYSGPNCSRCEKNCWFGNCALCMGGCKDGWVGIHCNKRCRECPGGLCNKYPAECTIRCSPLGDCRAGCEHYCYEDSDTDSTDNTDNYDINLSTDTIVFIVVVTIYMMIGCFCCYIKIQTKNATSECTDVEVVPASQRPLYQEERNVDSNAFTYLRRDDYVDSVNLMTLPFTSLTDPGNILGDVNSARNSRITETDMPPPSYEQCTAPPPSYDVLFKTNRHPVK